ncbi:MAG: tetratricopeptide repeat protein [Alphaproteobacteria bacterium]|nr:tetratricopeptide repeat protein [Alphaproteobacteria bacterium]
MSIDQIMVRASALHQQGRLAEAEALYRAALGAVPGHPDAACSLGLIAIQVGQPAIANTLFDLALQQRPNFVAALANDGVALNLLGHYSLALYRLRQALALSPQDANNYFNLSEVLAKIGEGAAAEDSRNRAVALALNNPEMHFRVASARHLAGQATAARNDYRRTLALSPAGPEALAALGNVEADLGLPAARTTYRRAIHAAPGIAANYVNAGSVEQSAGRTGKAATLYRLALCLEPGLAAAWLNLGNALPTTTGALACFARSLHVQPWRNRARSSFLYTASVTRTVTPDAERALACEWERHWLTATERAEAGSRRFAIVSHLGDRLQLGVVSAEFGQHAVAYFLEPLLAAMDRQRIRLTLYPISVRHDHIAGRFCRLADHWHPLWDKSDAEASDEIRKDRIDVLIDTTSHTSGGRLGIFAHRSAPAQCHYLGYHGTSGLTEMDYFVGDDIITPPEFAGHFSEQLWRLPRLWIAYSGPAAAPAPAWTPAEDGRIRLGSFNNLKKVGRETLSVWAEAMLALPASVLILKDRFAQDPEVQARIAGLLELKGISGDRIRFLGPVASWAEHMSVYDTVDIALDTLPFNSGTTAFDALWMGVPLVALKGDWMGARMTASMLHALDRPGWVAEDKGDYVAKIVALAEDVDLRHQVRIGQRSAMRDGMLCDATGLARAMEKAFMAMIEAAAR